MLTGCDCMEVKRLAHIIGLGMLITSYLLVVNIFLTAYSRPDKRYTINIDFLGESGIELGIILVSIPFVFYVAAKHREKFISLVKVKKQNS